MGIICEEIKRYDPYTDTFLKNTTLDRVEIGTDGNLYRLTISNGNEYLPKDKLYTKADVVAMLEELNLEIDEMFAREINYTVDKIQDLIQSKINALKENEDGDN